jgi:ATP-binding cassette subfamily B protein
VNVTIRRGERLGVIGSTGSGKSTLLDVLMGLLEPSNGSFTVDGHVITAVTREAWQASISHVPQSVFLCDATIGENIAFGIPKEGIDWAKVEQAALKAQLMPFVSKLPEAFKTSVGERGVRLSGGQRQRIGIARALYRDSSVLVFDEATSALDNETEVAVMNAIESLSNELTIIMVAHRLSTLRSCDRIIEIERGRIVRSGVYSELIGAVETRR